MKNHRKRKNKTNESPMEFNVCRYELHCIVDELITTVKYAQKYAQDMQNIGSDMGIDIKNIAKIGTVCLTLNNVQNALKTLKDDVNKIEIIDDDNEI